jgi:hypothetical protein
MLSGGTKLVRVMEYGFDRVNLAGSPMKPIPGTDNFPSVLAELFFLVPISRGEAFPGSIILDSAPT